MANILSSVTVIEMGTYITGPAAAMQLADLGANVIKVERPGMGDPFRAFKGELYSPHFQTYNRNKRSIALDTTNPEDLEVMHGLIRDADVFIQNFRLTIKKPLNRELCLNAHVCDAGRVGGGQDIASLGHDLSPASAVM